MSMKPGRIKRYNLIMLSANRMLQETYVHYCAKLQKEPNLDSPKVKKRIKFAFDIGDFSFQQGPLLSTDEHNDSPMYYQIRECLKNKYNDKKAEDEKDVLRKHILYLDFAEIYGYNSSSRYGNYPMIYDWSGKKEQEELKKELKEKTQDLDKELESLKEKSKRARWLALFFEKGFDLTFEDEETIHFVPFDKSGNMSRNSKMCFLNKELLDEMDRRVCLDIDFTELEISLSKYYAYRGLLLTDGRRIIANEEIVLDEEHVIVLEDDNHSLNSVHTVTNNNEHYPIVSFVEKKNEKIEVNAFDGEGLIAPDYAKAINEQLFGKNKEEATSFQIRLPFGKGMLHQVDFQKFYKDQKINTAEATIEDVFGIKRALGPVRIILTKSMLKCTGWLKDFCKLDENDEKWNQYKTTDGKIDPMKYYFSKMKKYDHSLYIGNTDLNLPDSGKVKLNYQFLNTLDFSGQNAKELLKKHYAIAKEVGEGTKKSIKHVITVYPSEEQEQENEEREVLETDTTWKYALRRNPGFLIDKKIRKSCSKQEEAMIKDGGVGRVVVSGMMRYLSGDLLGLLIHSIKSMKLEEPTKSNITSTLKQNLLYKDKFYLPINEKGSIKLKGSRYYGLLRSPHLSRNEQVAMRPFQSTFYDDYFKHLRGVLMVSYNSTAPMALGGADYDGDYVKLITEPIINNAILSGTYIENEEGKIERKLPIPIIRSWGSNISKLEKDETARAKALYKLIDTTFDNRIGQISNLAIHNGYEEYFYKQAGEEKADPISKCTKCTILTGLEIDAAKNGARPNLKDSLKDIQKENEDEQKEPLEDSQEANEEKQKHFSYTFLKVKNKIEDHQTFAGVRSIKRDAKNTDIILIWNKEKKEYEQLVDLYQIKKNSEEPGKNESAETNNEKQILEILIEEMINRALTKPEKEHKETLSSRLTRFKYEKDNEILKSIEADEDRLSKTRELIATYLAAENSIKEYSRMMKEAQKFEQYRKAYSRLNMDYDFAVDKIGNSRKGIDITTALNLTYNELLRLLSMNGSETGSAKSAKEALVRMKSKEWHLTLEKDRKKVLTEIISTEQKADPITIDGTAKKILIANDEDRFFVLWYLLKTVEDKQKSDPDLAKAPIDEGEKQIDQKLYKRIWKEYVESLKTKKAKSILRHIIVNIIRKELGRIFNDDMDTCLQYCDYLRFHAPRIDSDGDFFWSVFEMQEIKNCIYPEIKKENSDAK